MWYTLCQTWFNTASLSDETLTLFFDLHSVMCVLLPLHCIMSNKSELLLAWYIHAALSEMKKKKKWYKKTLLTNISPRVKRN